MYYPYLGLYYPYLPCSVCRSSSFTYSLGCCRVAQVAEYEPLVGRLGAEAAAARQAAADASAAREQMEQRAKWVQGCRHVLVPCRTRSC